MNAPQCVRENELLDALGRGFTAPELAEHVDGCASCSELRLVASALLEDRVEAVREAAIPSAAAMWWRMQMRRRQEAQIAARRSLLIGQAATLAVALGVVGVLFGGSIAGELKQLATSIRVSTPILLVVATWIVAAPIAGWVATRAK